MRPNFIFIGPDKSGSSWLHYVLSKHPNCYVPPSKDIYFFDRYYDRGLDWYCSHFASCPQGIAAIGELSHDYLFSPDAAARIYADLPGVKLITTLRNPIERSFSQYLYMRRNAITGKPFEQAVADHPEIISNSMYAMHLEAYYSRFAKSNIKIMFYDLLSSNPRAFAYEVFDFLALPPIDMDYEARIRPASEARSRTAAKAAHTLARHARNCGYGRLVGWAKAGFLQTMLYRPYRDDRRPALSERVRAQFASHFEPDISRLERLLAVDLRHWHSSTSGARP